MTLTLAATQTIAGVAGTGSAITYTLFGDEITGTTDAFKVLQQGTLPTSAATLYTASSVQAVVKQITLQNVTAGVVTVSLYANGTANANKIWSGSVPANGSVSYDGKWTVYDASGFAQTAGATGPTGSPGAAGRDAGLRYTYSNNTASSDPGAGFLKFDNATLGSITNLRISETDGDGNGIAALIASWAASTSTVRSKITIIKDGAPANTLVFSITGALTDNGTWDSVPITFISTSGTFANNDVVKVHFSRTGDKGDTGNTGPPGPIGTVVAGNALTGGGSSSSVTLDLASDDPTLEVLADNLRWRYAYGGLVTGANRTYTLADRHKIFTRSNSDAAMTDTLPTMAAGDAGWSVIIHNINSSAAAATGSLTVNAGGTNTFLHDGSQTHVMYWGTRQTFVWTGSNWAFHAGNTNLTRFTSAATVTPNAVPKFTDATGRVIGDSLVSINYIANPTSKLGKLDVLWIDVVADFGADPTGVVDSTAAIQNAIAAAGTQPAGAAADARWSTTIYFPSGTYKVSGPIGINKTVRLQGAGRSIANINTTELNHNMFHLSASAAGAGFEQLRLTGPSPTGRTGRPQSTTIAAGSNGYVIPIGGFVNYTLNVGSTTGMPAATPANPQVINFQSRFGGNTYWDSVAYTGMTATTLTGVTGAIPAQQRTLQTGDLITWGGYAIDLGGAANAYVSECDILFHKNGIRSAGGLQFVNDANIRETNNVNNDTSEATASACIVVEGYGDRYLRRITTDNGDDWLWMAGIRIRECASCVIVDSNVINCNWALDIAPNQGLNHAVASVMAMNTFWDSSSIGCRIRAVTANDTAHRIRFVQCWFSTMKKIQPTTGGHPAGGQGCTIEHQNCNSIDFVSCDFFDNTSGGLVVTAASDWAVRASRFSGNGVAGVAVSPNATNRFTISDNFIGDGGGFGRNFRGITIAAGTYLAYNIADNRGLESNGNPFGTGAAIDVGPHHGIVDSGSVVAPNEKQVRDNLGTGANALSGRNTVSQSIAGTVLQNVTGLSFPIVASGLAYAFDAVLNVNINATGSHSVGVGLTAPTGATIAVGVIGATNVTTFRNAYINAAGVAARSFVTSSGVTGQLRVNGMVAAGATTGVVQIQLSAGTGSISSVAGTATVQAGAFIRADKL